MAGNPLAVAIPHQSTPAVHNAMASIAARAARRATSKSSMSGAGASTIAIATRSTRSGAAAEPAVTIAAKLFATLAQNLPKAALQRPAKGTQSPALARQPPEVAQPRSAERPEAIRRLVEIGLKAKK
jgi:hypothetical protein